MSAQHSLLAPSSCGIWGKPDGCPGSVLMQAMFPEVEGGSFSSDEDARQGEASHEMAAEMIARVSRGRGVPAFSEFDGRTASNGVVYTEAHWEAAELYALDAQAVMRKHGVFAGPDLCIEERVAMPQIHPENWGTLDLGLFAREAGRIYLWDYKYGLRGVPEFENWQLLDYLAGLINKWGIDGHAEQYITVHFRICQPRAYHTGGVVREWAVRLCDVRPLFNIVSANAHEAARIDPTIRSGPHCRDCTARHACPAALEAGLGLYEVAMQAVPQQLSPAALGTQLSIITRALKQLEYIKTGYEQRVESLERSGVSVPGWKIGRTNAREKWTKSPQQVINMGAMLGVDLAKPPEPVTPPQARKLGVSEDVIATFSEKPAGAAKLVADNTNEAKRVFYYE